MQNYSSNTFIGFEMYVSWIEFVPNQNLNMHFLNKHANAQSSSIWL